MSLRAERTLIILALSLTFCMAFALIGRTSDWSPFALVLSGWVMGLAGGWSIAEIRRTR